MRYAASDIDMGMKRIDSRRTAPRCAARARPVYSAIDPAPIEPQWPLTVREVLHSDRFMKTASEGPRYKQ